MKGYLCFVGIFIRFSREIFWQNYGLNYNGDVCLFENFENFVFLYEIMGINSELLSEFSVVIRKNAMRVGMLFEMIVQECYEGAYGFSSSFRNLCHISLFLVLM